ncbi:tetratricopeptide repeat protein [Alteromonas lipolytica]|uniref:Uncharacterized protein n=1 Tax=Alteromonas lipolytica TaxID=1856405 RepID=A0A1E8FAA5_9ALTE|nr:tetratricopeptide repeat protein [Alteromonas lipolytica]OFI32453.1 hypothetical protein BFC17_06990 [Alteromonas lipolytica]GGF79527.1 hypothetical protein GCM10011338_34840 [Alteromonas lipolytica]
MKLKSLRFPLLAVFLLVLTHQQVAFASPRVAIVEAQIMIDSGEYKEAIEYLEAAIIEYPTNDTLLALYGSALYENKQISEAEVAFRRALEINPLNAMAADQIEVIRFISNASVSEKAQQIEELTLDKLFDLIAMAMAFALGTMMSKYLRKFSDWNFMRRSRKLFRKGDYDDFVDLLEIQLSTNELKPLRGSIHFMQQHMSEEEITTLLNRYVNTEDNLHTLSRMVRLSYEHGDHLQN